MTDKVDYLDEELDDTDFIDFERSIHDRDYQKIAHPHIKLDNYMCRLSIIRQCEIRA